MESVALGGFIQLEVQVRIEFISVKVDCNRHSIQFKFE